MSYGPEFIKTLLIMAVLSGLISAMCAMSLAEDRPEDPLWHAPASPPDSRWRWAAAWALAMAVAVPLLVARLAAVS